MTSPSDSGRGGPPLGRPHYAAALWIVAKVLQGRTTDARVAQLDQALAEARLVHEPAVVDRALADLRVVLDALLAQDPLGRTASCSTPAARERRVAQQHAAHAAASRGLFGEAPEPLTPEDEALAAHEARKTQLRRERAGMQRLADAREAGL